MPFERYFKHLGFFTSPIESTALICDLCGEKSSTIDTHHSSLCNYSEFDDWEYHGKWILGDDWKIHDTFEVVLCPKCNKKYNSFKSKDESSLDVDTQESRYREFLKENAAL